jgi:MinD-like ATPase involved in chromosome partitioning or flagellar assembly
MDNHTTLVDLSFGHPCVGKYLGIQPIDGLDSVVTARRTQPDAAVRIQLVQGRLGVIPLGKGSDAEMVSEPAFRGVLADASAHADYVLMDGPALIPFAQRTQLLALVDAVLVVCSPEDRANGALDTCENLVGDTPVFALVNRVG